MQMPDWNFAYSLVPCPGPAAACQRRSVIIELQAGEKSDWLDASLPSVLPKWPRATLEAGAPSDNSKNTLTVCHDDSQKSERTCPPVISAFHITKKHARIFGSLAQCQEQSKD